MKLNLMNMTGYIAGFLTTVAFVPQVLEVYKKKSTAGLNTVTLWIFFIGQLLWLYHGFLAQDISVLLAAAFSAFLYILLLFATIYFKRR